MENSFIVFDYVCTYVVIYILMCHNMMALYFYLPYFYITNNDLFLQSNLVLYFCIMQSLPFLLEPIGPLP